MTRTAPENTTVGLERDDPAWHPGAMPADLDLVTLDVAAQTLGLPIKRVHQLLSDGELVAVRGADGIRRLPAAFLVSGGPVKGLPAVITLLRDAHYGDDEIIDWLFREDDSLPGTPIQALCENRGREAKRRAQVAGF